MLKKDLEEKPQYIGEQLLRIVEPENVSFI